jgi:hypothetical protein
MASADDPHSPTAAGPTPEGAEPVAAPAPEIADAVAQAPVPPAADPPTEPTPTVGSAQASYAQPAGSALLGDGSGAGVDPHPEKLVGAAFAGGLVTALFLKGLAKRKHA